MAVSFSRTLQAIQADRPVWRFAGLSFLFVLPVALGWLLCAEITVYEVSSSAHLESLPQTVAAEVEGKVVEHYLQIGLEVVKGQVLVRLDDKHILNLIAESRNQIDAAEMHIKALQNEIEGKEALKSLAITRKQGIEVANEELNSAGFAAEEARQHLARAETLAKSSSIANAELDAKRAIEKTADSDVKKAVSNVKLAELDYLARQHIQEAELLAIRTERVKADGELAHVRKQLATRNDELEKRTIVSNVAGRVEEVVPFRIGNVIKPAEKLATIVPQETPRVVAFLPVIAVGRVVAGQTARLRMDGFPWTQYGTVTAKVTAVGNEPADGLIRVELDITNTSTRIPLKHGQTASVEIAVEQASPAMLILRAAGEFLTTQPTVAGNQ